MDGIDFNINLYQNLPDQNNLLGILDSISNTNAFPVSAELATKKWTKS